MKHLVWQRKAKRSAMCNTNRLIRSLKSLCKKKLARKWKGDYKHRYDLCLPSKSTVPCANRCAALRQLPSRTAYKTYNTRKSSRRSGWLATAQAGQHGHEPARAKQHKPVTSLQEKCTAKATTVAHMKPAVYMGRFGGQVISAEWNCRRHGG